MCVHASWMPNGSCSICNGAIRQDPEKFNGRKREEVFLELPHSNNPRMRAAAAAGSMRMGRVTGTWVPKSEWARTNGPDREEKLLQELSGTCSRARIRAILREW